MDLEHVRAELELCQSGKETVRRILNHQQEDRNRVLIWLWRWRSTRNKVNAGDKMPTLAEILSSVSFYLMEINKLSTSCSVSKKSSGARWEPPPPWYYKVNVDASFHDSLNSGGWGFVARDWDGNFLEGGAGSFSQIASALQAESWGTFRSIERVAALGMTKIILETDSTTVAKAIMSTEFDRSMNGVLFRQIREFLMSNFVSWSVNVCPRTCNCVADILASYGCNGDSCSYTSHPPNFVLPLVSGDLPRTIV
jgi:ribonuclease HI